MGVFSWLGQRLKPQAKPDTGDLGTGRVINRWSDYPSFNLTPERLRAILFQADQGYMRYLMELYEEMEEKDAHLAAVLQTRKQAVAGLPLEIQAASEDAQDQEIAAFVEEQIRDIPDFQGDLLDLLDAIAKGYAASEIHWDLRDKRPTVVDLEWIHPKCISFVNSVSPLIITEANGAGIEPPAWKVIFHQYRGRSGDVCRAGVLRSCTLPYLLKAYSWKFWAIFNEVYGMPLRLGKFEPSASQEDRSALKDALKNLGTDAWGIISKTTEIEFKESAMSVGGRLLPYDVMIQKCNNEISKAVLGQTLTTDTSGATGTYAAGQVHEMVRQDLVQADAQSLAAVLREQLVRPLVGFNFGWEAALPKVLFVIQEAINFREESEAIKNLAGAGLAIPASHCYERYGIPAPEEGEETLRSTVNILPTPPPEEGGNPPAAMKGMVSGVVLSRQDIRGELDNLTQAANEEAQKYLARMLRPVMDLIDSGADEAAVKDRLLALYSRIDTKGLEVLLAQVRILANLRGRADE